MVQEALSNVRRHARRRQIRVDVDVPPTARPVEISDDGAGATSHRAGHRR